MCMGGVSLLAISCSNSAGGSSGGSGGTPASYIGSKKPTDAWAVGDFVYSDGSADSKDATLDATKKAAAVAVIFDATNKKGVGLKSEGNLKWAPEATTGYITNFNTDENDGSGNWAVIQAADSSGAASAATNYPAFNFCNAYGVAVAGVSTGWYLPAKGEIKALDSAKDVIDASIGKIGESGNNVAKLGTVTSYHWSSSQGSDTATTYFHSFRDGNGGSGDKKYELYVRAIRKF